jgi:hypothetical protein
MDLMMLDELVVPRVPLHDASFVLFECIPIELKHSVVNTHVVPYVQLFWGTVLWGFARCDGDENVSTIEVLGVEHPRVRWIELTVDSSILSDLGESAIVLAALDADEGRSRIRFIRL